MDEATSTELDVLLGKGRNSVGGPLSAVAKARIAALLEQPCDDTWGNAHGIVLFHETTLWQAIIAIDPTFPKHGRSSDGKGGKIGSWPRIPTRELTMKAIRFATH
jgi:hypothetical protein